MTIDEYAQQIAEELKEIGKEEGMVNGQIKKIKGIRWVVCECGHKLCQVEEGTQLPKIFRMKCSNCHREVKM